MLLSSHIKMSTLFSYNWHRGYSSMSICGDVKHDVMLTYLGPCKEYYSPTPPGSSILYTKEFCVKNTAPRIWDSNELQLFKKKFRSSCEQLYDCYNVTRREQVFWKCSGEVLFLFIPHERRHSYTMSLHGDLGRVIFGQDIHSIIEYLCERLQTSAVPKWELALWSNWKTRLSKTVFHCQDKRCKNTCRPAVVHSSRSPLWIKDKYPNCF